jgi:phosphate transport system substrate-binding protein
MEAELKNKLLMMLGAAALASCGQGNQGGGGGSSGQQIQIVGSSTVYPFTTAVAERFGQANAAFKAPIVESTGTGAGMKLFCNGVGDQFPDFTNASRRIKKSEVESCAANGVKQIVELPIGIDGLALVKAPAAARSSALRQRTSTRRWPPIRSASPTPQRPGRM